MEDTLVRELQAIVEACYRRGVSVFVIGAFGVRAYGSLLRRTLDLDLAVEQEDWPALAEVLEAQGYRVAPAGIWVTAMKGEGEEAVEIHIALGNVTDVQSALSYPVWVEPGTQQFIPDLNVTLPSPNSKPPPPSGCGRWATNTGRPPPSTVTSNPWYWRAGCGRTWRGATLTCRPKLSLPPNSTKPASATSRSSGKRAPVWGLARDD